MNDILKKYMLPLILLAVVVIAWLGIMFLSKKQFVPINPNANSYTKPLKSNFDTVVLEEINEKTGNSFPVLPKEFLELKTED